MHIPLTRAEMAKMMVTITALIKERTNKLVSTGRTKKEQCSTFSDLNQANEKLQPFIIKACELGLMGLQANGITLKTHFIPNETITIAEVATILSRFLRGNKYQGSEQRRYHNHLLALQQINFMPLNINPMNKERKTNVFEMLIKSITFINTYSK
ncbi:MAG: hypothetical protein LBP53_00630 [Candidatus Peribacteria bacterium]|jgi:hypothetical protein|nr:hypothetical protein [Candidatus Peribacteria bacterium]